MGSSRVECAGARRLLLAVLTALVAGAAAPPPAGVRLGQPDARLTWLYAPAAAPPGMYEVYRTTEPIASLAARLRALDRAPQADAWRVLPADPGEAFGSDGHYDRARLAWLFTGRRPLVARGSLHEAEGVVGYSLVTPFPDESLTRLVPETLVIVTHASLIAHRR